MKKLGTEDIKIMVEEYMRTCKPRSIDGLVCYEEEYRKALEALIEMIEGDLTDDKP